jgi:hypothetical protein
MSETYKATKLAKGVSVKKRFKPFKKTFKDFMREVDERINAAIGVSIHDLPDHAFNEYWFDDCETNEYDFNGAVETCASDVLYDNGFGES